MENFKPQNTNNIENKESPEQKHKEWMRKARIALEGVGFAGAVILSLAFIEKFFGVDISSNTASLAAIISSMTFMGIRRSSKIK